MSANINYSPKLLSALEFMGLDFGHFNFVDVGCSGGIHQVWYSFGNKLKAIGFDTLVNEIERLKINAKSENIQYEDGFIINKLDDSREEDHVASGIFQRTSATLVWQILNYDCGKQHFNSGNPVVYSQNKWSLDEALKRFNFSSPDFIKVDTDGFDFNVLKGGVSSLKTALGAQIEVQFHGTPNADSNTFANIDTFMRARGFFLFDLDMYRFSRDALPAKFQYNLFASTVSGQVRWGDALYLRDLACDHENISFNVTKEAVLKLAALFEIFQLPDCAAELLVKRRNLLGINDNQLYSLLDLLTPHDLFGQISYQEYMQRFMGSPASFFPTSQYVVDAKLKVSAVIKKFKNRFA